MSKPGLKVLMISRHPEWDGGVVHYISGILGNLSGRIEVDRFILGRRRSRSGRVFRAFMPVFDALRLLLRTSANKYQVVHINPSLEPRSLLRDMLMLLAIELGGGKGVIVFFHGWESRVVDWLERHDCARRIFIKRLKKTSRIIVLANAFRDRLVSWSISPEKIKVCTTAFDGDQYNGLKRVRVGGGLRIVILTRMVEEKGVFELLEAFRRLSVGMNDIQLVFVGDGPATALLKEEAKNEKFGDKILFMGYLKGKEKIQALLDADIFILPSYSEGCPVALLEAMAAGLPVVTTAVGGIPDIITNGVNGILLMGHKPEDIEKGLRCLIDNPGLRKQMGRTNYEIAWHQYESKTVAQKIESLYWEVANELTI